MLSLGDQKGPDIMSPFILKLFIYSWWRFTFQIEVIVVYSSVLHDDPWRVMVVSPPPRLFLQQILDEWRLRSTGWTGLSGLLSNLFWLQVFVNRLKTSGADQTWAPTGPVLAKHRWENPFNLSTQLMHEFCVVWALFLLFLLDNL